MNKGHTYKRLIGLGVTGCSLSWSDSGAIRIFEFFLERQDQGIVCKYELEGDVLVTFHRLRGSDVFITTLRIRCDEYRWRFLDGIHNRRLQFAKFCRARGSSTFIILI